MAAIHRIIEQHAALCGSLPAIVDSQRTVSYRELNYAANAVARRLMASGFRRGGHANVAMPTGIDLAVVLLAILKAGGSYTWTDPGPSSPLPPGVSISVGGSPTEAQYLQIDLTEALAEPVVCNPNLPIVTRPSDVACVLAGSAGAPSVMVPHETIAALRARAIPRPTPWLGDPGAFDLWMALMAGTTAVVEVQGAAVAAA